VQKTLPGENRIRSASNPMRTMTSMRFDHLRHRIELRPDERASLLAMITDPSVPMMTAGENGRNPAGSDVMPASSCRPNTSGLSPAAQARE
jgi:hypothetical protein